MVRITFLTGVLFLLALTCLGQVRPKSRLILEVNANPPAYGQGELSEKLKIRLSRNPNLEIVQPTGGASNEPVFPDDAYNADKLLDYAAELGGRYLLFVDVHNERVERKKTFSIPLLVQKYQSVGIIEGELRLVDVSRSKTLIAEPFHIEKKGPRIIQAYADDNINDADLFIPADSRVTFFTQLQDKLADALVGKVRALTNGR